MNPSYWIKAWREGRIGFHQNNINPRLQEHLPLLELQGGGRMLVPLCGKSKDMLWIAAQGIEVVGIEVSELAARAFFEEHGMTPAEQREERYTRFEAEGITILQGDFFAVRRRDVGEVEGFYDRAAFIAMPPEMRRRYARQTAALTPPGSRGLLLTIEYHGEGIGGPPFSVPDDEVRRAYGEEFEVTTVVEEEILEKSRRFQEKGATSLIERVYLLRRLN